MKEIINNQLRTDGEEISSKMNKNAGKLQRRNSDTSFKKGPRKSSSQDSMSVKMTLISSDDKVSAKERKFIRSLNLNTSSFSFSNLFTNYLSCIFFSLTFLLS